MKTIGQIAGRMKFTENEIEMSQGLSMAAYDLCLQFANKESIKLSKKRKQSIKENVCKLVTKSIWEYKEKHSPNKEIAESEFCELAKNILQGTSQK